MAADPGTTTMTFWITYPNGETPIGFIVHNKGFWVSSVAPEYFTISLGRYVNHTAALSMYSDASATNGYQAKFTAQVTTNLANLSNIEVAPIFLSTITE